MRIIIEFEDRYAVVLIGALTVLGWVFSYSLVYTTFYLSTGQDPMEQFATWIPQPIFDGLVWIGKNGGYVSVISGMIFFTIISALIIQRHKKKR